MRSDIKKNLDGAFQIFPAFSDTYNLLLWNLLHNCEALLQYKATASSEMLFSVVCKKQNIR